MAYTQADLDAIDAMIARGVLEERYGDKYIRYQSLADMQRARAQIAAALAVAGGTDIRRIKVYSDKDL